MSGKYLLFMAALASVACAKSNYQDPPPLKPAEKAGLTCSAKSVRCVRLTWETQPTETQMGSFLLEFTDSTQANETAAVNGDVAVVLWMPSMGHGSSPVQVEKLSEGIYRATRVFFVMPGEWDIRVQIKNGTTVTDEIVQQISI